MPLAARKAETRVYYRDPREKILTERFADVTLDMGLTDGYNTPCAAENRHKKQHMAA
jgi:hypothetical protein